MSTQGMNKKYPLPLISLIAANMVPLGGVIFLRWDVFLILILYWSESFIVGFYNILKLILVRNKGKGTLPYTGKIFSIPFFIVHYSAFMWLHGLFLLVFSKKEGEFFFSPERWPCLLVYLEIFINVFRHLWNMLPMAMLIPISFLFVSNGVSFLQHFILEKEYLKKNVNSLMKEPYSRIVVMHFAIILGAFLSIVTGTNNLGIVIVLVFIKTLIDAKSYLRMRRKAKDFETTKEIFANKQD
ncbi:MAG: DUF6498-containing protein [Planctomycetota bacterium]|jgi:hypothetical protein